MIIYVMFLKSLTFLYVSLDYKSKINSESFVWLVCLSYEIKIKIYYQVNTKKILLDLIYYLVK